MISCNFLLWNKTFHHLFTSLLLHNCDLIIQDRALLIHSLVTQILIHRQSYMIVHCNYGKEMISSTKWQFFVILLSFTRTPNLNQHLHANKNKNKTGASSTGLRNFWVFVLSCQLKVKRERKIALKTCQNVSNRPKSQVWVKIHSKNKRKINCKIEWL